MKFRVERDIVNAQGTQTYEIEALSIDEAVTKFNRGEGDLVDEELEVTPDSNRITSADVYERLG